MDYPSREELLALRRCISMEMEPLWPKIQLWGMDQKTSMRNVEYRHLFGTQANDESLFTPIFEVYAEWEGSVLCVKTYRYHDCPQVDLIDPHNPIEALLKIDMKDVLP